jgi:hypothetical protein
VSVGVAGVADWPVGVCGIVAKRGPADHASNEKREAGSVQSRPRINRDLALDVWVEADWDVPASQSNERRADREPSRG